MARCKYINYGNWCSNAARLLSYCKFKVVNNCFCNICLFRGQVVANNVATSKNEDCDKKQKKKKKKVCRFQLLLFTCKPKESSIHKYTPARSSYFHIRRLNIQFSCCLCFAASARQITSLILTQQNVLKKSEEEESS